MSIDSIWYEIAVTIHVLAAMVWVGGITFVTLVAVPVARSRNAEAKSRLLADLGRQFRTVGWTALGLLVATGSYMIAAWGATPGNLVDGTFFQSARTRLLGYKLLLVAAMLVVSGIHDWWLGPRSATAPAETDGAESSRTSARWLGRLTGLLALGIVILAVSVARPWL